jgi:gamma-glutamyl hercynylcysteine S-oxide synthase
MLLKLNFKQKNSLVTKDKIMRYIIDLYNLNNKLVNFIKHDDITGFESVDQGTNPLLWEIAHLCYFYEYHCFNNILENYNFYIDNGDLYDSFKTSREYRFICRPHSKKFVLSYLDYIFNKIIKIINEIELTSTNIYLFLLVIMHNHMHIESIIFTKKLLGYSNILNNQLILKSEEISFEFIKIKGSTFLQGTYEGENLIAFDNEMPQFETIVDDFVISKYCVTEKIVLDFILNNGYENKNLWSINGWRWVQDNNISLPFYWIKDGNQYFIKNYNNVRKIENNLPACHISWYEAEAICKWNGGRLPLEKEWEYLATNGGNSKYPWGNTIQKNIGNLNYSGNICSIDNYSGGDNKDGVRQLFGNVWEWCQEAIYPYDGFKIDPIYKEFSYPFFGFKKILRGGSWATPDILINSRYRNAQLPDCRIQFTGFRIVKDLK